MLRISYASRLALYAALILIAAVVSTSGIIAYTAQSALRADIDRSLDTGLSTLQDLIATRSGSHAWALRDGSLYSGEVRLNGDTALVDAVKRAIGGSATVFAGATRIATSIQKPDGSRAVGTELAPGPVYDTVLRQGRTFRGEAQILGQPYLTIYEPIRDADGTVIGILYVGIPQATMIATVEQLMIQIAIAGVFATLIGALIMYAVLRRSIRPITDLVGVMARLRDGDLTTAIPLTGRHDTLGDLARSIAAFQAVLVEQQALRASAREQAAQAVQTRKDASLALAQDIESRMGAVVTTLQGAAAQMSQSARSASAISGAAEDKATSAAASSGTSATNIQVVASASEEMAASIAEVSERAVRSAGMTHAAAQAMASVETTMADLSKTTVQIGSVVGMIAEIASQTNLLALNATIEAARAGVAGKGFAVVAREVKDLAQRSKAASAEVQAKLDQMGASVAAAVATMEQTVSHVRGIDEDMTAIAASVQQQRAATSEISRSVAFTATGMQEVAQGITAMHADVTQTASVIRSTESLSHDVTHQGETLKTAMHEIVAYLRAA